MFKFSRVCFRSQLIDLHSIVHVLYFLERKLMYGVSSMEASLLGVFNQDNANPSSNTNPAMPFAVCADVELGLNEIISPLVSLRRPSSILISKRTQRMPILLMEE